MMRHQLLLRLGIVACILLPRILHPDPYTLGDEPRWVIRADEAFTALREGRWSDTGSLGYPGVMLMATLTPAIQLYQSLFDLEGKPVGEWPDAHQHRVLVWSRLAVGFGTACAGIWLFILLRQLSFFHGREVLAGLIAITVANEPWVLGLSRTTLLDAYLSLFVLLAVVAAAVAREKQQTAASIQSGIALGLAFLTKGFALFFGPFILLAFLDLPWQPALRRIALWIGSGIATAFVLWPALWVHPIQRVGELLFWSRYHAEGFRENLYWPGIHPPFLLLALSLPLFFGCIAYLVLRFRDVWTRQDLRPLFFADLSFLAGLVFQAAMAYVESDNSRWIVPSIVLLALPGAVGFFRILHQFLSVRFASAGLFFANILTLLLWFPHMNLYTNPLFRTDVALWQIGMGEGFPELARYLESQPEKQVVAISSPGLLRAYLTSGHVRVLRLPRSGNLQELPPETTHVVLLTSRNRTLFDPGAIRVYRWMDEHQPIHTVTVKGVPLLPVYAVK